MSERYDFSLALGRRTTVTRGPTSFHVLGAIVVAVTSSIGRFQECHADVHLEWRPAFASAVEGEEFRLELYAVSDNDDAQTVGAMNVIVGWEPDHVQWVRLDDAGAVRKSFSGFPNDPYHLNESNPPADGDGMYIAFAQLGNVIEAPPEGALIPTFVFEARMPILATRFAILEEGGHPTGRTIVFDGERPNYHVTGTLGHADLAIVDPDCSPVEKQHLRYRERQGKIVAQFQLVREIRAGWYVTVECVGPDGQERQVTRQTSNRGRRRAKFLAKNPGLYTCVVVRLADPQDRTVCAGRFREAGIDVP